MRPVSGISGSVVQIPYSSCQFQQKELEDSCSIPKVNQLTDALKALSGGTLNGYQVLVIVREWGICEPLALLEKVFDDIPVENISDKDLEVILSLSGGLAARIPDHRKTEAMCKIACTKNPESIKHFPQVIRTRLLPELVERDGLILGYLSEQERTFELCSKALQGQGMFSFSDIPNALLATHPELLNFVRLPASIFLQIHHILPDDFRTREFYLKIAESSNSLDDYDQFFKCLPKEFKDSRQFYKDFCARDGSALECVPAGLCDEELYGVAVSNNWMALKSVPVTADNYELLCQQAIEENGLAIGYIDKTAKFFNYGLCLKACSNIQNGQVRLPGDQSNILSHIPENFRTDELCLLIIKKCGDNSGSYLQYLSDKLKNDPLIRERAIFHDTDNIDFVAEHNINDQMCLHLARQGCICKIPPNLIRPEFYDELVIHQADLGSGDLNFVPHDKVLLKHCQLQLARGTYFLGAVIEIYKKVSAGGAGGQLVSPEVLACLNLRDKFLLLNERDLDSASRDLVLKSMIPGQSQPLPEPDTCPRAKLYEAVNVTERNIHDPFLPELVAAAYNSVDFSPPWLNTGIALDNYVCINLNRVLPVISEAEPLKSAQSVELIGGRTLKVTHDGEIYFYKFQRQGETLNTLISEGLVHEYLSGINRSIGRTLKSEMPREPVYFKIPADSCGSLSKLRDSPAITLDIDGRKWVNVYRYKAVAGYGIYAHQPDLDCQDPTERPEKGLLYASHDIGLFIGMGLIPTSLLPAFHDYDKPRRWVALWSVLKGEVMRPNCASPGIIETWNTSATNEPDIGYSGFKDVADYEVYGKIQMYVRQIDTANNCHPPAVAQRIMLANAIKENLMAIMLVYARLNQHFSCYHYRNPNAVEHTKAFLEQHFTEFLQGYFQSETGSTTFPVELKTCMGLDDQHYQSWLHRSALELIYWTAAQPDINTPDSPAFIGGDYNHSDCYGLHIRENRRLAEDLYPGGYVNKFYPQNFWEHGGLKLGAENSMCALNALSRGLTLLGCQLLKVSRSLTENRQPYYGGSKLV